MTSDYQQYIKLLITEIEKDLNIVVATPSDFTVLSTEIFQRTKTKLSESTLKRIWGYSKYDNSPRISTLNTLARMRGFAHFDDYCQSFLLNSDSEFIRKSRVDTKDLHISDEVELVWGSSRKVVLKYKGNNNFLVVSSEQSKLEVNDAFALATLITGIPLYIGSISRGDITLGPYVAGKRNGIESIKVRHLGPATEEDDFGPLETNPLTPTDDYADWAPVFTSSNLYSALYKVSKAGRRYMVKCLTKDYRDNPVYIGLLKNEYDILANLEHPNICQAIDFKLLSPYGYCMVMEYVDGITLAQWSQNKLGNKELFQKLVMELCDALSYIHKKQIVHSDLKPDNILIIHKGNSVKIIDFGLSDTAAYENLTATGGNRKYASPEQLRGETLDQRSDLYAMAALLKDLFGKESYYTLPYKRVFDKCLQLDKNKRYDNAHEVYEQIARGVRKRTVHFYGSMALLVLLLLGGSLFTRNYRAEAQQSISSPLDIYYDCYVSIDHLMASSLLPMLQKSSNLSKDSTRCARQLKRVVTKKYQDVPSCPEKDKSMLWAQQSWIKP